MVAVLTNVDAAIGCSTKSKAYITAMKSDLRNLVSAEESLHSDSGYYSRSLESLGFRHSTGTTPPEITLTSNGWYATNGHTQLPGAVCAVYAGSRPAAAPEIAGESEVWCDWNQPLLEREGLGKIVGLGTLLLLVIVTAVARRTPPAVGRNWPATTLPAVVVLQIGVIFMGATCQQIITPLSAGPLLLGAALFATAIARRARAS